LKFSPKEILGVMLLDLPRYRRHLAEPGGWVHLANRRDRLEVSPDGAAVRVLDDPWSSDLQACEVMPALGRRLFEASLAQWPVAFVDADSDVAHPADSGKQPDVTFVIPFRSAARLEQLRWVVRSVMAQRGACVECLLVEQSNDTVIDLEDGSWPMGVRHLHLPHVSNREGWHKAWAFNEGVKDARAEVIVCHDGDIVVPRDYAVEILKTMREQACEVVHLQRLLFCLNEPTTGHLAPEPLQWSAGVERVRQNWQGGTLAISRSGYETVGGFDEDFVDWGGEDNEFYDRCRVLKRWDFGYLPFVHLWHPAQDTKAHRLEQNPNLKLLDDKLKMPRARRIAALTGKGTAT